MLFVSPKIIVDESPLHGRGVFAVDYILKDEMIEECHFVKCQETDFSKLDKMVRDIAFAWPMFTAGTHAIVLGFGSIYNHSENNNATWETDVKKNCYRFKAIRDIEPGEEICTNYLKNIDF